MWGTRGSTLPLSLWNYSCSMCKQASVLLVSTFQREDGRSGSCCLVPSPVQAFLGTCFSPLPLAFPPLPCGAYGWKIPFHVGSLGQGERSRRWKMNQTTCKGCCEHPAG